MPQVPQVQTASIELNVKSIKSSTNFCDLRNDDSLTPAEKKQFIGFYDEIIRLELISKQEWEIKWSTWMKTSQSNGQTLFQRILRFIRSVAQEFTAWSSVALLAMVDSAIATSEHSSSMTRPRFEFSTTMHASTSLNHGGGLVGHSPGSGAGQRSSAHDPWFDLD